MRTHTPGPYTTSGGGYIGICAVIKGVSRQIGRAEVVGTPGVISDRECEANASLFAAAPDLLQALKALLDISPFSTGGTMDAEIHRQAEVAVAKAEGR